MLSNMVRRITDASLGEWRVLLTFMEVKDQQKSKHSKLCSIATKLCQKVTVDDENTFIGVTGQQRSNEVKYVLWLPHLVRSTHSYKLRMMHRWWPWKLRTATKCDQLPGPKPILNILPWYSIKNSHFSWLSLRVFAHFIDSYIGGDI